MRFGLLIIALILCLTGVTNPEHTSAAEKSYYSPIISKEIVEFASGKEEEMQWDKPKKTAALTAEQQPAQLLFSRSPTD